MAQRAQPVRGMRDIGPPEAELRRRVAARILDVYARFGYEVIETPALEDLEVLVGSGGGENEKLIFKVLKRGARLDEELREGGELADTGLRFDLTVPLARFVTNHLNDLTMPFKVAHIAPVWRAERPQRGRYREFTQCDIDIVGEPGIAAEVELCGATIEALQSVGINGSTVRLNDRRLLRATVEQYLGQLDRPEVVYIALDKLDKVDPADVAAELARAGFEASAVEQLLDRLAVGEMDGEGRCRGRSRGDLDRPAGAGGPCSLRPYPGEGAGLLHRADLRDISSRRPVLTRRGWALRRYDGPFRGSRPPDVRFLDRLRTHLRHGRQGPFRLRGAENGRHVRQRGRAFTLLGQSGRPPGKRTLADHQRRPSSAQCPQTTRGLEEARLQRDRRRRVVRQVTRS